MTAPDTDTVHPAPAVTPGTPDIGFGVYVHWPFCAAKCPYCDFNSHVRHGVDQEEFAAALARDIATMARRTPGRRVTSIFFGGGTPSLMEPRTVDTVLAAIDRAWPVDEDAEITLEANPTSAEAANFAAYSAAGVNRLSVGVQSLDDTALRFLGRRHSAAEALDAVAMARRAFERVSFDLIYARPDQSIADWRRELRAALDNAPEHISAYQLTIEPGTAFFGLYERGALVTPGDDAAAALFELTGELCEAAGFEPYEVSNHARPGAESRHNLLYWRYGEYVGIGPGAHSRLCADDGRIALEALASPELWRAAVAEGRGAHLRERRLGARQCAHEMLLMGMRLSEGVLLDRIARMGGEVPSVAAIAELEALGLVHHDAATTRLRATPQGRLVLNSVIAAL